VKDVPPEKLTVDVGAWTSLHEPVRRAFPGPPGASALLRVSFERGPYADLTAHAKDSLNAEVGGVLVGLLCEDDNGPFVHVTATIRADEAKQGRGHITFTHKTWDAIHATMEKQHPGRYIVGWYHTHPGFGVEFSAMDKFIHENFFAQPFHVALVTDPLGGSEAMCINSDAGVRYLERFWVDSRERKLERPEQTKAGGAVGVSRELAERLDGIETRLNQVIHALDEHRISVSRWVLMTLFILVLIVFLGVGLSIRDSLFPHTAKPTAIVTNPTVVPPGTKAYLIEPMVRVQEIASEEPAATPPSESGAQAPQAAEGAPK